MNVILIYIIIFPLFSPCHRAQVSKRKRRFGGPLEEAENLSELLLAGGEGAEKSERRARGGRDAGAPCLLGYPLGFPLTFI